MKIAILSFYSGTNFRGVERWVTELSKMLSQKHQVVVYQNKSLIQSTGYKVQSLDLPYNPNKKEVLLPWQKKAFLDYQGRTIALFTLRLVKRLWSQNFDIIIPTDGGWEPAFIRILSWLQGGKMVIVGHSGIGWDDINNLWTFPDCFVALSNYAQRWAKRVNPFVKVVHIPDGIDLELFRPFGKKVKLDLEKPVIICVGSSDPGKRIDLTIKAVSRLSKGSLLILGVDENSDIYKFGKATLGKRFEAKKVSFEKMPEYYRSADVFSLASWSREAFGMVYLEAMACGLTIVATDDELRREIIGGAGVLVDPTDTEAYAKAIEKVLNISWGDKPIKQTGNFSWNKIAAKYEDLFLLLFKQRLKDKLLN